MLCKGSYSTDMGDYMCPRRRHSALVWCNDWAGRPCPDHCVCFFFFDHGCMGTPRSAFMHEGEQHEEEREREGETTASDTGVVRDGLDEMKKKQIRAPREGVLVPRVTQQCTSCETVAPVQRHHGPLQAAHGQTPGADYEKRQRRLRDVVWAFGRASTGCQSAYNIRPQAAMGSQPGPGPRYDWQVAC